jgi:Ca-activated chloride channel family protein
MNLSVQTDRSLVRAPGKSVRYVLVSFTAPEPARRQDRPPVNVSLVIDRSGSMGGQKIELAKTAVGHALRLLRSSDRFSVVSYDDRVDIVVPSTLATPEAVKNGLEQVRGLQARGSTDLGGGWLKGCEQIAEHLERDQVGRCLLLTDGLANQGIVDHGELTRHAEALRQRGVTTSTFGVGADFDERLLEAMSRAGAGHFYYVETAVQIPDYLTSELGEALEVVARDVAVTVRAGSGITVETLNSFRAVREPDAFVVHLGDLTSRQEVSIVLRMGFPVGRERSAASAVFGASDAGQVLDAADTEVVWTFADHAANDAQPRNIIVDRVVARLYAAKAQAAALDLNREDRFEEAQRVLAATARRIRQYARGDAELLAIIEDLEQKDVVYASAMSPQARKAEHYASMNVAHMRTSDGKARRRPNS